MAGYQYFYQNLSEKRILEHVTDKLISSRDYITYHLIRLQKMFHYENLPETIPYEMLEYALIMNGTVWITEATSKSNNKSGLYAISGSYGGAPDAYYRPTIYVWAQPDLGSRTDTINLTDFTKSDGILMRNDTLWNGLFPLLSRYSALLSENILTMRTIDVLMRMHALISSPDDKTKKSADLYLQNILNGKLSTIADTPFFDGVKMQNPSNSGNPLSQTIEYHQYIQSQLLNEIGLNSNYNMKRESLVSTEASLNEDYLLPLMDNMMQCRKEDIELINKKYGTSIEVHYDSTWLENEIERILLLKSMEESGETNGQSGVGNGNDDSGNKAESIEAREYDNIASESDGEVESNDTPPSMDNIGDDNIKLMGDGSDSSELREVIDESINFIAEEGLPLNNESLSELNDLPGGNDDLEGNHNLKEKESEEE